MTKSEELLEKRMEVFWKLVDSFSEPRRSQVKKMMELKKQADMLKRELEKIVIEYNEVRGIKIKLNGAQMFQSIEVDYS